MNWYTLSQTSPQITVVSLDMLLLHLIRDNIRNKNIISIRDPIPGTTEKQRAKYRYIDRLNLPNLLILTFDDLWREEHRTHGTLPEEKDVSQILQWAKTKWRENHEDFYVHCTAGISRSSSVATLLNTMFRDKKSALAKIDPKYHNPNRRILDIGEKMLNTPGLRNEVDSKMKAYKEVNKTNRELIF